MMRPEPIARPRYSAALYFLARYKSLFLLILVLTVFSSVVDTLSVVAFFPVFSSLLGRSDNQTGGILGFMTQAVGLLPFSNPIVGASVLLIGVFLVKTLFTLLRDIAMASAAARAHYDVRRQIIQRYAGAHYQYILDNQQGSLLYNILGASPSVTGLLHYGARMVGALFETVAIIIVLISILPMAALALVVAAAAYYASMMYLSKKVSFRLGTIKAKASAGQMIVVNEFLNGFRQIITLNCAKWWTDQFDREGLTLRDIEVKEAAWNTVPKPVMDLSAVLLMLGLIFTIWLSSPGAITSSLPVVGVFAVALAQLMPRLTALGTLPMQLMGTLPNLELVYQVITGPVPTRNDGTVVLESFEKAIVFENVSFSYRGRESLFDGLNLIFEKGAVTAIAGSSGAGKTTIINLILGLFEPTRGRIIVDGIPLQELKQASWLGKIGFVSQEPFTYHATVADNILLGRNGRSKESIVEAAKIANAHDFVSQLPEGYDTVVGERGMKISGGQQQRLAIARALLDSPEILIFDEATSNLDNVSEKLVQEAINNASSGRTVIIIAHRLSTISHADKIIVFENGKVVEEGNHQQLLNERGHYSRLAGSVR